MTSGGQNYNPYLGAAPVVNTTYNYIGSKYVSFEVWGKYLGCDYIKNIFAKNRTACIRHQCKKTTVLSCHRCIINTGVEKMNNI